MSYNYKGVGSLNLTKITPIIQALFSGFGLGDKVVSGELEFFGDDEDCKLDGSCILDALDECSVNELKIDLEFPETYEAMLNGIAAHFKVSDLDGFAAFAKTIDEDHLEFEQIFKLATYFDDGHGLNRIKYEEASSGEDGPYGGSVYITKDFHIDTQSSSAVELGGDLESSECAVRAAEIIQEKVEFLLNSFKDVQKRAEIRAILTAQLASLS